MRSIGLALVLAASVVLGARAAHAGGDNPALEPAQTSLAVDAVDEQLDAVLTDMIASADIGPNGEVFFRHSLGDRRFLEPNSGRYWQISATGQDDFRSRSLWDRRLEVSGRAAWTEPFAYDSDQFPDEPLRIAERTVRLPGSDVQWQFVVAGSRGED